MPTQTGDKATCDEVFPDIYTPQGKVHDPKVEAENKKRGNLYAAVTQLLRDNFGFDRAKKLSSLPKQFPGKDLPDEDKIHFLAVYGTLLARNLGDPSMGRGESAPVGPDDQSVTASDGTEVHIAKRFIEAVTDAEKQYNANKALFQEVFDALASAGTDVDGGSERQTVHARQLAEVTVRLINDGVPATHPQIHLLATNALSQVLGGEIDGLLSDTDIALPRLDEGTAIEIIAANVRAIAMVYFSAMLEELKYYAVADKVAEHFMIGMLPISRGPAGDRIYAWLREGPPNRFSEVERRSIYGRTLGLAQGAATDVLPNREFSDLWFRFLSAVTVYNRDKDSQVYRRIDRTTVIKAARDLAVNLSLHGYGVAHFAAVQMQKLIKQIKDMLSRPELLLAYGVNDDRQLVERVSAMYLGGSVNGVRYRTMAQSGGQIILWLADKAPLLASEDPMAAEKLDLFEDRLSANAAAWLAVTGTQDNAVDQYSEPVDIPSQSVIPPFAPTSGNGASRIAQNVLDQVGLPTLQPVPAV
jgi:hypothetical protein